MLTGSMRRSDRQITDRREMDEILENGRVGHLAMAMDGQPYVVPMTYLYLGDSIVFHGASEGQKARLLAANPDVCFEVSEFGSWVPANEPAYQGLTFRSVIVFGRIAVVNDAERKTELMAAYLEKYTGQIGRWKLDASDLGQVQVLELRIDRLTGKRRRSFVPGNRVRLRPPELMASGTPEPPVCLEAGAVYTVAELDDSDRVRMVEVPGWFSWMLFERIV